MHGNNRQTSTTAPRYLSVLLKAENAVEVDTEVVMEFEGEYKVASWQMTS